MVAPVHSRSIETGGRRLAWLEAGAGWPVILLHAFPLKAEMWRPQLERVPAGWRFIAPDLRGFGRAHLRRLTLEDSAPTVTVADYAADVFALMDALEIDDAVIGGMSMGGYVAFAMFRQAPGRFAGMILADTRPQADTAQGREARVQMRALLAEHGPSAVADQMLPKLFSSSAPPDVVAAARQMIESADRGAIDAAIGALMSRPDSTPDLARMTRGTLVIVGEDDVITPVSDARAMQSALPRSTLTVIPGAGHLSSLEQPDIFSRGLADFLAGHL
jgi:pimeloyl-ACP methyl ester carboxylesterase